MTQLLILLAGVYAIAVGYHGNGSALFAQLGQDMPHYAPWIVAILILSMLAVNEYTEQLGRPLLLLIVLGLVLRDWPTIKATGTATYNEITGATAP